MFQDRIKDELEIKYVYINIFSKKLKVIINFLIIPATSPKDVTI